MLLTIASYAALISGANGPDADPVTLVVAEAEEATAPAARLHYDGDQVIITGSVEHMFEVAGFVGPNRVVKQDRQRISVDVNAFSGGFASTRTQIAALRAPVEAPPNPTQSDGGSTLATRLAEAGLLEPETKEATLAVASVGPLPSSSALDAIDSLAPDAVVPMPVDASTQLAYARETAPVTDFTKAASTKYSEKDMWCLATAIYFEARGENYRGQAAVAQVVMNRTKHKLYPKTLCGVVFQNQHMRNACQFSFACDGQPESVSDKKSWAQAEEIAGKVASGELYLAEVGNATHYHATYVYPHWAPKMTKVTKIGLHVFYRFKRNWKFG